jgi:hypothetical protein
LKPKESRSEHKKGTTRADRKRKGIELTLSDEAREELVRRAEKAGVSQSRFVEAWLLPKKEGRR